MATGGINTGSIPTVPQQDAAQIVARITQDKSAMTLDQQRNLLASDPAFHQKYRGLVQNLADFIARLQGIVQSKGPSNKS